MIVWAVGRALLLGEVNGQAFWSAGTSAVPCIWVGLEIMLPPCAGLLCRLSGGATGNALQLSGVTCLPAQAGDRMCSTAARHLWPSFSGGQASLGSMLSS